MSGRRDTSTTGDATAREQAIPVFATTGDGTISEIFDPAAVVFADDTVPVDDSIESLAADGVLAVDTPERFRAARNECEDGGNASFRTAVERGGDLEAVTYSVDLEATGGDEFRWSMSELGLPAETAGVLEILEEATDDIGKQGAVRNVFGALERWVNNLLGPTGVDVRRADRDTDELIRMTRGTGTIPVDDRSVIGQTESPYESVWPAGDPVVIDDPAFPFDATGFVPVGADGVIAIGRVGADVTTADLQALQTLAAGAATAVQAVEYRSVVNEQRAEMDRYETLVESIPDPVYSTDASGRITFVNRAFEEAFGYELDTCRGMHITEFVDEDSKEMVETQIRDLLDPENVNYTQLSATGVKADGRECELEASFGVVYHDDEFDGVVGVLRDVTERKRNEEISAVMNRALRHNLRTSINNIIGYAELTEQGQGDTDEYMSVIREEGQWLMKLGDTMRAVRRSIDTNGHDNVVMSVGELVEPLVAEYDSQYPEADIQTHYETETTIQGGSTLQVAIENIIENAIVHNERERPEVDIMVTDGSNSWIDVEIQDNGQGIEEREVDLVLGDAEITQLQHGTGIGLWLTRWIVEIFEGELDIETNEQGTLVTIRLQQEE